jgi:hypothetical protein
VPPDPKSKVRDLVAPVFLGRWHDASFEYGASAGTAFLIGDRGYAITAAHVIDQIASDGRNSVVGFVNDTEWVPFRITAQEKHPSEDVAVIQLEAPRIASWLVISDKSENQSCTYDAWGYPFAIAELSRKYEEHQLESPDLVYTSGYVRRRISKPLPVSIYRGTAFYEMSEVAGEGCSGGPVIARRSIGKSSWDVIGVYVAAVDVGFEASYAVRSDAFFSWCPKIIGCSVREESLRLK